MIPFGAMMGFSLQLYIAVEVMYPHLKKTVTFCKNHPLIGEIIFRIFLTFLCCFTAINISNLGLLISMIGAICSPSLAFVFPVIMNISLKTINRSLGRGEIIKNCAIISLACFSVLSGVFESINEIKKL